MSKLTWPEIVVVTVLGTGFSPVAPATVASAVTCVILWFIPALLRWPWALLVIPVTLLGVWWSQRAIITFDPQEPGRFRKLRRPSPKKEDPDQVVFDEFAGQWITLLAVPHTLLGFVLAFLVFRFLDIVKPLGIRATQRYKDGWGVMLDDVVAGVYGAVPLFLTFRIGPLLFT
ncbi:phosphatidylglycerophosphatase A [bacterium]|nr:phosphatidylglycerophosphatase A [bacterium]MBU1985385.1 phosphatidylglycerophosphatase A [bacterium]